MDFSFLHMPDMGEYSTFIWLSYAVAAAIMLLLLWQTVKELNRSEENVKRLQNVSGAALTSHYSTSPTTRGIPAEKY